MPLYCARHAKLPVVIITTLTVIILEAKIYLLSQPLAYSFANFTASSAVIGEGKVRMAQQWWTNKSTAAME
jgi:hypothetical protein